ncbi:MAG: NCS2 family permease, partial [Burkholderiales bacterium]|nr:NCS2 family permease [Burkholderiales bacterium]
MAYIIFVNPAILAQTGMDFNAVFVATCLAAAFGTAVMALLANYPIALAPGMGLNAYFTFAVVKGMGVPWQTALGAVFISGVVFVLVSSFKLREVLVNAIPHSLKLAISAGVGLFLAIIG